MKTEVFSAALLENVGCFSNGRALEEEVYRNSIATTVQNTARTAVPLRQTWWRNGTVVVVLAVASLSGISAQQTNVAEARPAFEVVSIRPNRSGRTQNLVDYRGETFTYTNARVAEIIRWAYGIGPFFARKFAEVKGEPNWTNDRYDIVAKTAEPVARPRVDALGPVHSMVQSLLADRFNMVVHWEQRERLGYALVLGTKAGPLGPSLRPSDVDCDAFRSADREARAAGKARPLRPPVETPGTLSCGTRVRSKADDSSSIEILMHARSIQVLADELGRQLGQPIIDRTGLSGNFDIQLTLSPDRRPAPIANQNSMTQGIITADAAGFRGPSLFDAVRRQLGLRLESTSVLVEVLVIDRLERPSVN